MKQILLLGAVLCSHIALYAQQAKGTITDAQTGQLLAGATVSANNEITRSDSKGHFAIACPPDKKLLFSFVGYISQERNVNCQDQVNIRLEPVVRALSAVEVTANSQGRSTLDQPASVDRINRNELQRGTGLFLEDAINTNVPGVMMQRRTLGAGQQLNIRGYNNGVRGTNGANSNFDIQGTKVYLNGIPLTDAEGITLLDDIDFSSLGNVEVVKGPSGTLYGLAIAGAVNLSTIRPEPGKTSISQQVTTGSYGLRRYTTQAAMGGDKASLLLNYGYQHADGFMIHTASTKRFVNAIGDFRINDKQNFSAYFGYSNSYDQRAGELTISQYLNGDYSGNPEYIKRNAHSEVISFRTGLAHSYRMNNNLSFHSTVFGTGMTTNASSAGGWTDKNPVNLGLRSIAETRFQLKNGWRLSGITGVETQRQWAQITGYNMVSNPRNPSGYWIIGAARSNQSAITGTSSVFTEWTVALPGDLSVTAGLGWSTMKIRLEDKFYVANSTLPLVYEKRYSDLLAPRIAVNKVFNRQFSVYASYSTGYKAPVSSYFFIPQTGEINRNLIPESGKQMELGTKGLIAGQLNYQVALFRTVFDNKMTAIAVPLQGSTTTTAYAYIANGGKQIHKGLEAQLHWTALQDRGFISRLQPFANFTYSHFRYDRFVFETLNATRDSVIRRDWSGKPVAGTPKLIVNAGLDFETQPGIYGNLVYNYRDAMPISSDGLNIAHAYHLWNARLGFRRNWGGHFSTDLAAGVNNIFGKQYYQMVFVNQLPDAYLPAPREAHYFGQLQLRYSF